MKAEVTSRQREGATQGWEGATSKQEPKGTDKEMQKGKPQTSGQKEEQKRPEEGSEPREDKVGKNFVLLPDIPK